MITTEKVTVTLPTDLMALVCTLAPVHRQSQFIAVVLRIYITEQQRKTIRERLVAGYQTNAKADRVLAAEWEPIADETWPTYYASPNGQE